MLEDNGFCYMNCCLTSKYNPDYHFDYPRSFANATDKYIVIRECYCSIINGHLMSEYPVGNILVHADFVQDKYCGSYVCLSNSPNMKKKKFRLVGREPGFNIAFTTIDGEKITPDSYIFDILLQWRPGP